MRLVSGGDHKGMRFVAVGLLLRDTLQGSLNFVPEILLLKTCPFLKIMAMPMIKTMDMTTIILR